MSKGLEAIQEYKRVICPSCQYYYGGKCNSKDECFSTVIEKELKVIEIVKKAFDSSSIYSYKLKDSLECGWITQEEYDLLKEVIL